jgi:adenylate cyclase
MPERARIPQRESRPTAEKRPRAATPLDDAARVIRRFLLGAGGSDAVANEEIPLVPTRGTGTERPVPEWVDVSQRLHRCFAFVDISGFTSFTDRHGTGAAIEVLNRFRSVCRDVTGRRGVRVAKWLGDGAMLVGTEPGPIVAAVGELMLRIADDDFDVHAGIAAGTVLLFEGDDYIGRPVNVAARLCDAANPGEILCVGLSEHVPEWVDVVGSVTVRASGMGDLTEVVQLSVSEQAWASEAPVSDHPSMGDLDDPMLVGPAGGSVDGVGPPDPTPVEGGGVGAAD